MISIERLTKRFEERTILEAVSLKIAAGKITAICGPSGGGKSTLLRCIVGLDAFDDGVVRVGDLELRANGGRAREDVAHDVRLRVGFVFQHFGLFNHMTVLENVVEAPMHVRRQTRAEATERASALLERFGIGARSAAYPRELSGGEKQRVAIARALAMSPKAILLDEPTSALDPQRKAATARMLEEIAREGTTIALVTHEHELARSIADVAVVIQDGRVRASGAPAEVLRADDEH